MQASTSAQQHKDRPQGPIDEVVALRLVGQANEQQWSFETVNAPFHLGNANRIAYGGFVISSAVAAAYQTLPKEQLHALRIYSVLGNFLGPTSLDAAVQIDVSVVRQTRTFCTRLVTVKQQQPVKGASKTVERSTLAVIVDFVVTRGDRTLHGMRYSVQPRERVSHHADLLPFPDVLRNEVSAGTLDADVHAAVAEASKPMVRLITQKHCPEGIMRQNLSGVASDRVTQQDGRALADKVTYDWFKYNLDTVGAQRRDDSALLPPTSNASAACLYALTMDAYLSFLPLVFTHRYLFDVEACSTLDFALRFHVDEIACDQVWNLREMTTAAGSDERTYSQARVWHEDPGSKELLLVATMTQSSVMRAFAQ
jgi:acyl-CoA thioesterase